MAPFAVVGVDGSDEDEFRRASSTLFVLSSLKVRSGVAELGGSKGFSMLSFCRPREMLACVEGEERGGGTGEGGLEAPGEGAPSSLSGNASSEF